MSEMNTILSGQYLDGKTARAASAQLRWREGQWEVCVEDFAWQTFPAQTVVIEEAIKFSKSQTQMRLKRYCKQLV
jgi:hypothetical protein